MEKKEFSKYTDDFYKWDVNWDKDFFIKSIINNEKENFYIEEYQIWERKENDMLFKNRIACHDHLKTTLIDRKLIPIIETAHEDTDFYINAHFLLNYLKKILENLEDYNKYLINGKKDDNLNKSLKCIFETEDDENKFYDIAEEYMYAWFESTLQKCREVPSEFYKKELEKQRNKQKQEEERLEIERLEIEKQKKEQKENQENEVDDWVKSMKEEAEKQNLDKVKQIEVCIWCDKDRKQQKKLKGKWITYCISNCKEHENINYKEWDFEIFEKAILELKSWM